MKRTIAYLIIMCLTLSIQAQTIHWITFIDTTDPNIGLFDVTGRKVLYNRFINVINAALSEKGYNSDVQDFYDDRTSPENCKRAIENFTCLPEDIIIFYYIGHGGRPATEDDSMHPFPQMWLAQYSEEKMIPLEWVHNTLKKKNAKLAVTIGMCCNVKQDLAIRRSPNFSVNYGNTYLNNNQLSSIQNMFLSYKGDFILSSALPGQSSIGADTPFGGMDLFTAVLVERFESQANAGTLNWEHLFKEVKQNVSSITEGTQTPFFVHNITADKPQEAVKRQIPTKQQIEVQDKTNLCNSLIRYIDFIIDSSQETSKRILVAENLQKHFGPNAVVKVIGQDGDTVIDKEYITDFIQRLSTSRILLKVVPTTFSFNNDIITSMKVKEYYKEK